MPNYVQNALHRLQHSLPTRLQRAPHCHNKPAYGQKIQVADSQDDTKEFFLPASDKTLIQKIIGFFLYYGIDLNLTMLVALGTLATQQSEPTESASHPDAKICFSASNMILHIARDGSYLSETKSRSHVGGIFYLSSKLPKHNQAPDCNHCFNVLFHVVANILKMITSSAMETDVAADFYNAKDSMTFTRSDERRVCHAILLA